MASPFLLETFVPDNLLSEALPCKLYVSFNIAFIVSNKRHRYFSKTINNSGFIPFVIDTDCRRFTAA